MSTARFLTLIGLMGAICAVLSERGIYSHVTGTVAAVSVAVIGFLSDGSVKNV